MSEIPYTQVTLRTKAFLPCSYKKTTPSAGQLQASAYTSKLLLTLTFTMSVSSPNFCVKIQNLRENKLLILIKQKRVIFKRRNLLSIKHTETSTLGSFCSTFLNKFKVGM